MGGFVHGFLGGAKRGKPDIFQALETKNGRKDELCYTDKIAAYIKLGVMKRTNVVADTRYTLAAFLVAPVVAAFGLAFSEYVQGDPLIDSPASLLVWTFVFYSYALLATLLLGLPSFIAFRRLELVRWWSSIASGFVIGMLVLIAIDPTAMSSRPGDFVVWGGLGGLSAFSFWLVWQLGLHKHSNNL